MGAACGKLKDMTREIPSSKNSDSLFPAEPRGRWRMWRSVVVPLAGAVVLFSAAGAANRVLLSLRDRYRLTQAPAVDNMPPMAAFTTVALGGFRGILADLLWMRAGTLQDEGRFFELAQLSDWIARLQPRSPAIWAFHAWNMAYNVPALMANPVDRWRWVRNGIGLLRDDGMSLNPGSARLHRELAWLFLHKLGSADDHFSPYYREEWAKEADASEPLPSSPVRAVLEETFGPLDWHTPQAHAIYWAWTGLPYVRTDFDDLDLRRVIYQALLQRIYGYRERQFCEPAIRFIEETAARHPEAAVLQDILERLRAEARRG